MTKIHVFDFADFQKLEREARICRKLQHPNIGKRTLLFVNHLFSIFTHYYIALSSFT